MTTTGTKQRIISFLLAIIIAIGGFFVTTQSASAAVTWKNSIKTGYTWGGDSQINILQVNGKAAYCLEYYEMVSTVSNYVEKDHPFTDEQWDRLVNIAHFGYNEDYKANIDFATTQVMIWREIMTWEGQKVPALTDTNIPNLEERIETIEKRIAENEKMMETLPSFADKSKSFVNVTAGKEYVLYDTNEVLGKYPYEVTSAPDGVKVEIDKENNSLLINATNSSQLDGKIELSINRQNMIEKNRFYYHNSSQNVANMGYMSGINIPLSMVVTQSGDLELLKVSESGKAVVGAEFKFTSAEDGSYWIGITGEDGYIRTSNVEVGTYEVEEISVPAPYILDTTIKEVTVYPDQTSRISFTNHMPRGEITILKTDKDGNKLSDAEFKIWSVSNDPEGNEISYEEFVTSDENGLINANNLPLGTYKYQETKAPYGYVRDTNIYTVEISYKDQKTPVISISEENINEPVVGIFKLTKYDETESTTISGAEYRIWSDDENIEATVTTDENGMIILENLPLGSYNYQELNAPYEYLLDDSIYHFEIKYAGDDTPIVTVNKIATNKVPTGELTLVKNFKITDDTKEIDIENASLKDAKYVLYAKENISNAAGTKIIYKKDQKVGVFTTDSNGESNKIENLPMGQYYVKEVRAPKGCYLDNETYEVSLEYADQYTDVIAKQLNVQDEIIPVVMPLISTGDNTHIGAIVLLVSIALLGTVALAISKKEKNK